MKGLWFTELQTPELAISCRVKETLHSETTPYQQLAVLDTEPFGRMLTLDGVIQTTIKDEFVYHEMITHVALNTHPNPRQVLVIGGGDGGSIREILKHRSVERAVLVDIDGAVVEASKKYLPEISVGLKDPRAEVRIEDGIKYIKEHQNEFDVIIVDSTDPVGPAVGLFAAEFYRNIHAALKEDGIFVAQTESPFYNQKLIYNIHQDLKAIFPVVRLYLANVPTYPGGLWSFTLGSKKYDPLDVRPDNFEPVAARYYTPQVHQACLALPAFVQDILKGLVG